MLSLTRDLLRKTRDKNLLEIKPLTVSFWSDFAANPAVMYGLFEQNTQRLVFDPEKVNVVGNDYGICKSVGACFTCLLWRSRQVRVSSVNTRAYRGTIPTSYLRPIHAAVRCGCPYDS
jgi:hypothetical protein